MGIQSSIWSNRFKTLVLVLMFPILATAVVWLVMFVYEGQGNLNSDYIAYYNYQTMQIMMIGLPLIVVRFFISFIFYRQIIFKFSEAKIVDRKTNPEIYNIVENLCISRGVVDMPQIGIMEDDSMNAFATGRGKNAWIVFSRGILSRLDKTEIEAVAGHELTHILQKDTLLMVCVVVFVGIFTTLGDILLRIGLNTKSDNDKKSNNGIFIGLGIGSLVLGWIIFPLIRLAISRKREFLADAGSVELTHDKHSMISALRKISTDPIIESIKKETVASMCIASPFNTKKYGLFSGVRELFDTHPSIEHRIQALENY